MKDPCPCNIILIAETTIFLTTETVIVTTAERDRFRSLLENEMPLLCANMTEVHWEKRTRSMSSISLEKDGVSLNVYKRTEGQRWWHIDRIQHWIEKLWCFSLFLVIWCSELVNSWSFWHLYYIVTHYFLSWSSDQNKCE